MCSKFVQRGMDNYQGDLADIIRGSGGNIGGSNPSREAAAVPDWQFSNNPTNFSSGIEERFDGFGDPFSSTQDPLLHDIDMPSAGFFTTPSTTTNLPNTGTVGRGNTNIFSRMLQISPSIKLPVSPCNSPVAAAVSPRLKSPATFVSNDSFNSTNSKGCLLENAGLQISSPRNTGIKRRKSQAKKVVCIPAPAPANSRQSGEVVPSDLWAWRKYGQKPIKGSPYPRGYYRCSSSKGCSARKQVERSRTDPNMLVITYTSEHNHPWPTQRNALAGSTRSQPAKTISSPKTSSSASQLRNHKSNTLKDEPRESSSDLVSSSIVPTNSITNPTLKVENDQDVQKEIEMEDVDQIGRAYPQSYNPPLPVSNQSEDFFADLGEIERDPLNLLFTQGFSGDDGRGNKNLDPFSFYDWPENNTNNSNATLLAGEAKKSLQQNH